MDFQAVIQKKKNDIKKYYSGEINRYRLITTLVFICIITLLAWQSDDAYHAYIMAKNLVLGNGFVYNVGERASATSCPLFTLVIAFGYFFIRKMFIVSLLICIIFSTLAYRILVNTFCKTKRQVILAFAILVGSFCFISYTTSGLENSLLFFLAALFLKYYFDTDTYESKRMLILAILISLIAMTRMDAVLMFVPMILYVYLAKREKVSFIKAVGIGFVGLLPFIGWELFSVFYFGFPVPNTAYVKLGTQIPLKEYLYRGLQYTFTSGITDVLLLAVPFVVVLIVLYMRKEKYIYTISGMVLYAGYLLYIGGDFMVGRHFTVMFFMSVCTYMVIENQDFIRLKKPKRASGIFTAVVGLGLVYAMATGVITSQFMFGNTFSSPISDERGNYFRHTSLFNNTISYLKTGKLCIRDAWNEAGIDELREYDSTGGLLKMVPGISIYYNSDLYLNDLYALGDPFLSKLPAVREDNWRIGHMWREAPAGYGETVMYGSNMLENEHLAEYYDMIRLITRGDLFSKERMEAIIKVNMGEYDYLIEEYRETLDENCMQIKEEQ